MVIAKDRVVIFHYVLTEPGQGVLEDTHSGKPSAYLHGHHGLLRALEEALEGKQAGDHVSVTLSPEQGYGQRVENAPQRVPISHIISPARTRAAYKPGMIVQMNTKSGVVPVTVVKVGLKMLDVDFNHPYAGKTLTFDVDVIEVRDADHDEIAHGHAHLEGGHPH